MYYNKFDFEILRDMLLKIIQSGYMDHGLEHITFYVKHMAYLVVYSGPLLVRDQPLGAPAFVVY